MSETSLRKALQDLTVAQLRGLIRCLREPAPKGPKAVLVDFLHGRLKRKSVIEKIVGALTSLEVSALAEAVYHGKGTLDLERFRAKYGKVPKALGTLELRPGFNAPPAIMVLVYGGYSDYWVPREFHQALRALLDRPASVAIDAVEHLPKTVRRRRLTVFDAEQVALQELGPVLRLVQQGGLKLTARRQLPTKGAFERLSGALVGGDHYPDASRTRYEQAGPIRAFAWPQLLLAGKLATIRDGRLAVTANGRKALGRAPAETLKSLWKAWLKWQRFDEFSRIDSIRGQHHGPGGLSDVIERRQVLARALTRCPVGEWVGVEDFLRFMQVEGFAFEVCEDPWDLYVEDRRYGSLGYDGFHGWNVLQKRYVLAFLFEYTATLGLVDLACVHPTAAECDYDLWGADFLPFLSRYDGLEFFRLNAHGAWCLGLGQRPGRRKPAGGLRVMPSLLVKVDKDCTDPQVDMLLDTWAEKEGSGRWRLNRARMLEALENGLELGEFEAFLNKHDDQPLPEPVEALFKSTRARAAAVSPVGPAFIYQCRDAATRQAIARHPDMASLCQPVGDTGLVVAAAHEPRFREILRVIGYGMDQG